MPPMQTVYLDHAATTPMFPEAVDAMAAQLRRPATRRRCTPPGGTRAGSSRSRRETIAQALNCRPGEVVFTSGGTESDNLALKGIYWARRSADPRRTRILSTSIEHHAVLDPLHWLGERRGRRGRTAARRRPRPRSTSPRCEPRSSATPRSVALISVMWANNEVGTLQPIAEVVAARASRTASRCTPTRCRRSARCRSTSPGPAWTR